MNLWLLAAGCVALVGCRTEGGEEESSSWFDFSTRQRGSGQGGRSNPCPPNAKPEATKPKPDPVSAAWNEPADGTKPRAATDAPIPTVETRDAPKAATGPTSGLPLPTDVAPQPRAGGDSLPLPTLPDHAPTTRPSRPVPGLDLPATGALPGRAAKSIELDAAGQGLKTGVGDRPGLEVPDAPRGAERTATGLPLPAMPAEARAPAARAHLGLPELAHGDHPRQPGDPLRLPSFDDPAQEPSTVAAGSTRDLTVPNRPGRTGESLDLPELSTGRGRRGTSSGVPIDWDGLLTEPKEAGAKTSPDMPDLTGGNRPGKEASPANRLPADAGAPLTDRGPKPAIPGLRPEATPRATTSPAGPRLKVEEGRTAAPAEAGRTPRLDPVARPVDPRSPATPRSLSPGPTARAPEPRIPLPFRLSEWISDEGQHRLWREQHLERAAQEPVERQAEQERLRGALLKWLERDPAAK